MVLATLPMLLTLAPSGLAVRGGAGAQPLVVVGAGVLGRLAAQEWQQLHPGCEVLGVTRTRPDEEREAAMRAEGITHRYRSDIEAAVRCGQRWPYVLFSASPGGNDDYAAAVASALNYWDKKAPGARFVFTSSAGVLAEQDGGIVTEIVVPRRNQLLVISPRTLKCTDVKVILQSPEISLPDCWLFELSGGDRPPLRSTP